jgi:5-methylcytosine-specific restriction endonuclease McrA
MTLFQESNGPHWLPIDVGSVVDCVGHRYQLDAIEVENQGAIVYRATSLDGLWYGHWPEDVEGDTVFVMVLRLPLSGALENSVDHWDDTIKQMRRAMTLVSPSSAGFTEWHTIRVTDVVKIDAGVVGSTRWGTFQISRYRRRLAKAVAESRRPMNFSRTVRRSLLDASGNRCLRCGSEESPEVDHIVPVALGGTHQPSNGMVLCYSCHLEKTRAERKAFGQSAHHARELRNFGIETFQDPRNYLSELRLITGWSIDRS